MSPLIRRIHDERCGVHDGYACTMACPTEEELRAALEHGRGIERTPSRHPTATAESQEPTNG